MQVLTLLGFVSSYKDGINQVSISNHSYISGAELLSSGADCLCDGCCFNWQEIRKICMANKILICYNKLYFFNDIHNNN